MPGNGTERLVQLRIAYPRLMYNLLEEQETQTLDMVVGNVGGQIGLWVGGSVLSFVQVLVLLGRAMRAKYFSSSTSTNVVPIDGQCANTQKLPKV